MAPSSHSFNKQFPSVTDSADLPGSFHMAQVGIWKVLFQTGFFFFFFFFLRDFIFKKTLFEKHRILGPCLFLPLLQITQMYQRMPFCQGNEGVLLF